MNNTTVASFHSGVELGLDASLISTSASFVYLRGGSAILSKNPKTLVVKQGCIYKCEASGITVKLDTCQDQVLKKINISENRIVQITGTAIQFEGICECGYMPYELQINDNRINNTGTESRLYMVNSGQTDKDKEDELKLQKIAYQTFKNQPEACIDI